MSRNFLFKTFLLGFGLVYCGSLGAQTFANIPALSFTAAYGGTSPLPQILTVNSTGSSFNFNVSATTSTGGNWLAVTPSGYECCATPEAVTVSVANASTLAAGTYSGQIVFTKYPGSTPTMTVPVTFTVFSSGEAFFDNLPGQVSFSFAASGAAPPAQMLQVRNAGSGTLNWSLSSSTADGGKWLTLSSASGTAPSMVTIGVSPAALPGGGQISGTYLGQIVFQGNGSSVSIPVSVTVGSNVFEQVNPLAFTKPYAGNDPLPQTISLASTGSPFNFNAVSYNGSGGNWLSLSQSGYECCTTPASITVSVNPAVSLTAGTYTGEIVFTRYPDNGMSMTVPVSFTIGTTSSQAFFDNTPGQLSFSLMRGATAPPAQIVQVLNAGSGTLTWTLSTSTADSGKWLNTSAISGTAPSIVSLGIIPANLPYGGQVAGTFIGQVLLQTPGDTVTIPVSVTVGDSVFEQVNGVDFTKPYAGADPLPQTITVASKSADFHFNATAYSATGGNWLTVSPSGNECCTTPETLTISVNTAASLPAGTYTGQIVVTQYPSETMAMTIPVTLTVRSTAFFDNLPGQMSFSFQTGANTPPSQNVNIRNGGSGTLSWTASASTSDGGKWLVPSIMSGTAPSTLSVALNKAALPGAGQVAGTYTGQLVFQSAGDIATIPVSVVVGDSVFRQVNAINFTKPYAGANPLPQTLLIASTDSNLNFNIYASTASGGSWLLVSPNGYECCSTPESITVSINPAVTLAAGTYTGEIVVMQYPNNDISMTVPVTLTVAAASTAFFDNLPGQMSFSLRTGGSAPPSQPLQIRNAGSGTLPWTLSTSTSDSGSWLTASATSGTAPSTVSIAINPALLPNAAGVAGTYTGQIVLQSGSDVQTVPVSVFVGDSVFQQVNALNFTKPFAGANPLPQTLTVASTGTAFNLDVSASTATGGNWLTVAPSGNECCTTPESFVVSVNPDSSLPAGNYTGQIVFTQYPNNAMSMTVPVTLTVAPSGSAFFDNVQGQLSYSILPGTSPATHSIQIRNGGTGTLNWSLSSTTADGGNWLIPSLRSGTGPSAVTISVNNAALPSSGQVAGVYTGQVLLQTSRDSVTIPVSVTVGGNVFQQLDTVAFSKSQSGANPAAQTVTIASTGTNFNLDVSISTGTGGDWLQVTPTGYECCTSPAKLNLSVNPSSSLPAGIYTGQIVVTQYPSNSMAMTIPVYLEISASTLTPTTTSVKSSANPSNYSQSVTFTAFIAGGSGSGVSGTVAFYDGGTLLGSGSVTGITASFTTASLISGAHAISAVYSGNSTYSGSTSPSLTQTVGPGGTATTTNVTSSLNPSTLGSSVTFVATVTSSAGGISGTVTFKDASTTLSIVTLTGGRASYTPSPLTSGAHSITATYNGASGLAPSTSAVLIQYVLKPTTIAITSSANPAVYGTFVTLTATVKGPAAGQNGYVTFFDGGVPLTSVPLNGTVATLTLSSLAKGTHNLIAAYGGSALYSGSLSPTGSQVIQ